MDFSTNRAQPQPAAPSTHSAGSAKRGNNSDDGKLIRWGKVLAVGAVIVLLVALVAAVSFGGNNTKEDTYVDSNKLQAVFLNTGQVYFGNIKTLNNKYFVLTNIYYLQTSNGSTGTTASSSNTSVSLVKLGCELHEPFDKMVIN